MGLLRVAALLAIGAVLVSSLPHQPASAQSMEAEIEKAVAAYGATAPVAKKAFVIGIGAYHPLDNLTTPPIDATDMSAALAKLDFKVTPAAGSTRGELGASLQQFAASLSEGDIALFYYSGHGVQHNNFNYLVPSDTPRCLPLGDIVKHTIPVTYLMELAAEKRVAALVIILDACRTAAFSCPVSSGPNARLVSPTGDAPPASLGQTKGLAVPLIPPQTLAHGALIMPHILIALASGPNQPAWSGSDTSQGSIYTRKLRQFIAVSDRDPGELFGDVRREVILATQSRQEPWLQDRNSRRQSVHERWRRHAPTLLGVLALSHWLRSRIGELRHDPQLPLHLPEQPPLRNGAQVAARSCHARHYVRRGDGPAARPR